MDCKVRRARDVDADEVSRVILRAIRETNSKDYAADLIARVEASFSPAAVLCLFGRRRIFVAELGQRIVGTAGLDGAVVRTVFVAPDVQGQGIGRLLMAEVERVARQAGCDVLTVPSSITAEAFYAKLGFKVMRDSYHGQERTIIMERLLPAS